MCGFIGAKGDYNNFYIQKRGQDFTNETSFNGMTFIHNLLSITGEFTPQPFIEDKIICLFNGEIYNHTFKKSDGENIIPLYKKHGVMFPRELDGEFAIALYDFENDLVIFATDRFATKPLWVKGIECGSYYSGVGGKKVPANTLIIKRISNGETLEKKKYHEWDWEQYKTNIDDCVSAFEQAVAKRYKEKCFLGLSSGYDSGAIALALHKMNADFKCFTIIASEEKHIIEQRSNILKNVEVLDFDGKGEIEAEDFKYKIWRESGVDTSSYKKDYASKALNHICKKAHLEGRRVYLSGSGADEILSDYSLIPTQSELKGSFPLELKEWRNFTESCMYSYLGKEEYVSGHHNIETRYPFLDTKFVQEFLSLVPAIKNTYKAPLKEIFLRNNFPFSENKKIGFSI
ncbi:MAG: hypothetical protein EOL91_07975 [Actinobacteria bacterium]|nr:hypothetical protein [Actinomycetota bacterium]